MVDYSTSTLLAFDFNSVNPIDSEAALSDGDSSGGVFIYSNGQWKLAGVNYGVDSPWSMTGSGSGFKADIFDAGGLYADAGSGKWQYVPDTPAAIPAASYATSVSARYDWIMSVVPEPSAFVLLISGAAAGAFVVWRRHSRSRRDAFDSDDEF